MDARKAIAENGFYFTEDADVGRMVDAFAAKRYPFQTEDGLTFLRTATLDNKRVRDIIESHFPQCGLGMFKVFGPHEGTARAPLNRTTEELLALAVFLCPGGSRVILHSGSQNIDLNAEPGGTGLLQLPWEAMKREGIIQKPVATSKGGLIIADGRLFSTVLEGSVLEVGFAVEKELKEWAKMKLPKLPDLEKIVTDMGDEKIRMNFTFIPARQL